MVFQTVLWQILDATGKMEGVMRYGRRGHRCGIWNGWERIAIVVQRGCEGHSRSNLLGAVVTAWDVRCRMPMDIVSCSRMKRIRVPTKSLQRHPYQNAYQNASRACPHHVLSNRKDNNTCYHYHHQLI